MLFEVPWTIFVIVILQHVGSLSLPLRNDDSIISYKNERSENGYEFGYITSNGIHRKEIGTIRYFTRKDGEPEAILHVRGFHSYVGPDGKTYSVNYQADDKGYRVHSTENDPTPSLFYHGSSKSPHNSIDKSPFILHPKNIESTTLKPELVTIELFQSFQTFPPPKNTQISSAALASLSG